MIYKNKSKIDNKILIVASTFPRYKKDMQPAFVLDFAKSLSENFCIYILAPYEKGSRFKEKYENIVIYRFPYFFPGYERLAYRGGMINSFQESTLAKIQLPILLFMEILYTIILVMKYKIRIINAHWLFPQGFVGYFVSIILPVKIIITTHGGDVEILKNKKISRLLAPTLKNADAVTFVSKRNFNIATNSLGYKPNNFYVLPMGIELHNHKSHVSKNGAVRIMYIGRLVRIKGVSVLIEAASILRQKGVDIRLDIYGEGPLRLELENESREKSLQQIVSFKGYVSGAKKRDAFITHDVVVISSIKDINGHEEGLPVSALEAMSFGGVLIATNTGSLPELINHKTNGLLVKQNSPIAIADAIESVIDDKELMNKISQNSRITAKHYSWSCIAAKFINISQQINNKK